MELEKSGNDLAMDFLIMKAKRMELDKDVVKFLEQIKRRDDWLRLEWFYLCAVDRMPLAEMQRMEKANYTVPQIRKERIDFLKKVYIGLEPVYKKVEELKGEVRGASAESRRTKELLSLNLEKILEEQKELSREAIQAKEEVIRHLKERVKELERAKQSLEEKVKRSERSSTYGQSSVDMIEKTKTETVQKKEGIKDRIIRLIREDDETLIIKHFIRNDAYTEEQKNFIIDCLEEGYTYEDVSSFASEHFSLDMMKRLKELKKKK